MSPAPDPAWNSESRLPLALLLLASVLGSAAVLWMTPWGIGVGHDSLFYLDAAGHLRNGLGLAWSGGGGVLKPLVHFPPAYPASLAALAADALRAARLEAAVLFGLNGFLAGAAAHRLTGRPWAGLAVGVLLLTSPVVLALHLMAMSEPLFFALLLSSILLLRDALRRNSLPALLGAAFASGLAYLTRYAAAALIPGGMLAVLLLGVGPRRQRLRQALLFGLAGILPVAPWFLRNALITGSLTNRVLLFHPLTLETVRGGLGTISTWLLPASAPAAWRAAALAIAAMTAGAALLVVWRKDRTMDDGPWTMDRGPQAADRGQPLSRSAVRRPRSVFHHRWSVVHGLPYAITIPTLYGLSYLVFLAFSLSFLDASTRLDDRILSPLYLLGLLLATGLAAAAWPAGMRSRAATAFLIAAASLAGLNALRAAEVAAAMRQDGRGFTSRAWRTSETVALVEGMRADVVLYSNEAYPLHFLTGKTVFSVPERIDPVRAEPRAGFAAEMAAMRAGLSQPGTALVLFEAASARVEYPTWEELTKGLALLAEGGDGAVYMDPSTSEEALWK